MAIRPRTVFVLAVCSLLLSACAEARRNPVKKRHHAKTATCLKSAGGYAFEEAKGPYGGTGTCAHACQCGGARLCVESSGFCHSLDDALGWGLTLAFPGCVKSDKYEWDEATNTAARCASSCQCAGTRLCSKAGACLPAAAFQAGGDDELAFHA
ncbi:MAG: hypothetical protein J3K34DRAFT_25998 [Monoraphidium minutum]|nr:MAG: hypothetical protein J3K34DRAFT_25998 [Monoraphidium minutum]